MATTVRKLVGGSLTSSMGQASAPGPVSRTVLEGGAVEKAADLGGGYVLIKVVQSPRGRMRADSTPALNVPLIPVTDIEELLRHAAGRTSTRRLRRKTVGATKIAAEDNQELMARLDQGALERRTKMREQGLLLTSSEICSQLGISRQALSKAVSGTRMFYLDGPSNSQWYPSFFVRDKEGRRQIESISVALGDLSGPMKFQFFSSPKHSLNGETPVKALEAGRIEDVLRSAEAFRERSLGR